MATKEAARSATVTNASTDLRGELGALERLADLAVVLDQLLVRRRVQLLERRRDRSRVDAEELEEIRETALVRGQVLVDDLGVRQPDLSEADARAGDPSLVERHAAQQRLRVEVQPHLLDVVAVTRVKRPAARGSGLLREDDVQRVPADQVDDADPLQPERRHQGSRDP